MNNELTMLAVIPTPDWREALLYPGEPFLGQQAPLIKRWKAGPIAGQPEWSRVLNREPSNITHLAINDFLALPLIWRGERVPMGVMLAMRAFYTKVGLHHENLARASVALGLAGVETVDLDVMASKLEREGIALEVCREYQG